MRNLAVFGLILSYEFLIRLVFYGIAFTFAQHLIYPLGFRHSESNAVINAFYGFSSISSICWAVFADISRDGLFRVLRYGSMIYAFSMAIICLATYSEFSAVGSDILINRDWLRNINHTPTVLFLMGVFLFGASYGAIKTTTAPIIGNIHELISLQKTSGSSYGEHCIPFCNIKLVHDLCSRISSLEIGVDQVFRFYYWVINAGAFVGILLIPHFTELSGVHFTSSKAMPNFTWCQSPTHLTSPRLLSVHADYIHSFTQSYLLCMIVAVLSLSLILLSDWNRKHVTRNLNISDDFNIKTESLTKDIELVNTEGKKPSLHDFVQFLLAPNVLKIFIVLPLFWLISNQQSSNFILQAHFLQRPHWISSPSVLNAINSIILLLVIPLIEVTLCTKRKWREWLTPKRRIIIGLLISAVSMLYATGLQAAIIRQGTFDEHHNYMARGEKLSIFLQVPLYVLQTFAETCTSITVFELAYTLSPPEMKAFGMALYMFSSFLSSLLGMIITPLASPELVVYLFGSCAVLISIEAVLFQRYFPESIN